MPENSVRLEKLPKDCLDVLTHWFSQTPIDDTLALFGYVVPIHSFSIRLDKPLYNILHGGEGLLGHSGTDSDEYYPHLEDPNWVIVFSHDCPGDIKNGGKILKAEEKKHQKEKARAKKKNENLVDIAIPFV
jgi:hypothetical protein